MAETPETHGCPNAPEEGALSERVRARRQAILEAAGDLFLEKGFGETTLAEVVARSGGSLATLYSLFGSKRGLFEAILRDFADSVLEPLCVEGVSEDPERGLRAAGRRYLEAALEPKAVAWWRTFCAEAHNVPELSDLFLGEGGAPVQAALAGYLGRLHRAGRVAIPDPVLAAGQFLDLLRGPLHRRALACGAIEVSAEEIERQVAAAVQVFLHGYAVEPKGARALPSANEAPRRNP